MAKRERSGWDELLDFLCEAPVWVGPVLALVAFLGLRYGVPLLWPNPSAGINIHGTIELVMSRIAWVFGGAILAFWAIAELQKHQQRTLFDVQTGVVSIQELSWQRFEELVAEGYKRQGYVVKITGSHSGDGGVDVELRRGSEYALVQCKQWRALSVGVGPVRELLGVVTSERASRGVLITSGRFTADAEEFARANPIELIDGDALVSLFGIAPPNNTTANGARQMTPSPANQRPDVPPCPVCGRKMKLITAHRGVNAVSQFWGCPSYPDCKGKKQVR